MHNATIERSEPLSDPRRLPRLLAGMDPAGLPVNLAAHQRQNGPRPKLPAAILIDEVRRSGLHGRGGADFPTWRKLQTLTERKRVSAVVVNASETEPASGKDVLLISRLPHLVLDGAILAAEAVAAGEIIVKLRHGARRARTALDHAIAERPERIRISVVNGSDQYVSGEETAVLQQLGGGPPLPQFVPPRPYDRGYRGRPTLIQNTETLAHLALIARFGAGWFRALGTRDDAGTCLLTVSGAIASPGVCEVAFGTPLRGVIDAAGGPTEPIQAFLVGGYFGGWVRAERAQGLSIGRGDLAQAGVSLGSGVIIALGQSACGLHEAARLARYLAGESAGQCGPCTFGLRAVAATFTAALGGGDRAVKREQILRWADDIRGRGACHHPDGALRMICSALETFELASHTPGRCTARPAGLPTGRKQRIVAGRQ